VTFSAFPDIKVIHPECTNISWYGIEYYDNDSLFVFGFGGGLIGDCETLPDIQFFQAHHGIFNTTSSPISYTISGSDELQLIITDQLGTQAFYTDTQLKVSGNTRVTIAIYPNPVKNTLYFSGNSADISTVTFYSAYGQTLRTESP